MQALNTGVTGRNNIRELYYIGVIVISINSGMIG